MPPTSGPSPNKKHALITGGAGGIGHAIALAFDEAGYNVIITGLTTAELDAADAPGRAVEKRLLDVTDPASVEAAFTGLDRLDALVNCAGMLIRNNGEYDPMAFAQVIDTNLTGTMRMCQAAYPLLAKTGGAIVNLASMLSFFGSKFQPAYSASKGGVVQLTKSLAIAWAPAGVRVNAIAPGWITSRLTAPVAANQDRHQQIVDRTPMGRWGLPEDVAGAAVFLCSSAAGFITGATLPVDGGYSCT